MSSGFFSFFAHAGMLTALLDAGLVPTRVSGSSAGALVGGLWASGADLGQLRESLLALRRDDFWDPSPGLGVLAGKRFRGLVSSLLGATDFEATRVPLAVSVYEPLTGRTHALTQGALAPAIHASCAVPLMFHPVRIGRRLFVDGGVADRPGLCGMKGDGRVLYHHIASRSPWRRKGSRALRIPERPGLTALVLEGLPRASPFDLEAGRRALHLAYDKTRTALAQPVTGDLVRVP
jgi:NTE family protein